MSVDSETPVDGVTCPTCGEEWNDQQTMRIHHARAHNERLVDLSTCEYCGDRFEPSGGSTGTYCSIECSGAATSNRVENHCENCGDAFTVPKSEAEQKYCSKHCFLDAVKGRKHVQCDACGGWYQRYDSDPGNAYCSIPCRAEAHTERARPDDIEMLAWLLYVYEDNPLWETYKRLNVVRDEQYTKDDVESILRDIGVYQAQHASELRKQIQNGEIDLADTELGGEPR